MLGNGYRAYNPVLMRFHSPDSWSPFGEGGVNAYTYGEGDSVNGVDPTGHINIGKFFRRVFGMKPKKPSVKPVAFQKYNPELKSYELSEQKTERVLAHIVEADKFEKAALGVKQPAQGGRSVNVAGTKKPRSQKKSTPERRKVVLIAKTTGEPDVPNNVRDLSSILEVPESGHRNAIVGEEALNAIKASNIRMDSILY
ncbi:RHS repeat-associated core domain-containing protein [Pseudomonas syringae USA007]|uniref:RHS repeat-associated core domain-containing protein n=1 Tax=Pseudomonas syringae USA007 TaxID=1357288 RepID=A0AAU8MII7_PSESX|nr:RHS repeat-associated core domain-containing protein [Pseudomonas syringae]